MDATNIQQKIKRNKFKLIGRLCLTLVTFIVVLANTLTNFTLNLTTADCIMDKTFNWTEFSYDYLRTNQNIRNIFLIITCLVLDLSFLFSVYIWITKGKSWRPVIAVTLFLSLKLFCGFIFQIKQHDDSILGYTGFPSLINSFYDSKMFFSGSLGIYFIAILEQYCYNLKLITGISSIFLVIDIFLQLSMRTQYFMSVMSSLMASHYIYILSDNLHPYVNRIYNLHDPEPKLKVIIPQSNINNVKYTQLN